MATENNKRFVFRTSDKKKTTYLIAPNESQPVKSSRISPSIEVTPAERSVETEDVPARRVVVIRNSKHTQLNQQPIDLGDFGQPNAEKIAPVISNGVSIVFFP